MASARSIPIPGPDGRERRHTSHSDDDATLETGSGAQLNDDKTTTVPVANLVTTSDGDGLARLEGQAVIEQSAAERKLKQRRRQIRILGLVLVVAVLAAGIAVGVTLGINSNRTPASSQPHSSLPSPPPSLSLSLSLSPTWSPAPSVAPTMRPTFRQFYESLPKYTKLRLQNTRSPQYLAWDWQHSAEAHGNLV